MILRVRVVLKKINLYDIFISLQFYTVTEELLAAKSN